MEKIIYKFCPGLDLLRFGDIKKVKLQIMDVLHVKNRQFYNKKKSGIPNIPHHQYQEITDIFSRYGVAEDDVWEIINV